MSALIGRFTRSLVVAALLVASTLHPLLPSPPTFPSISAHKTHRATQVRPDYGKMPLYFVENRGQLDEQVAYYIQGADKTIYFTAEGVTFSLNRGKPRVGDDAHDRLREFSLPTRWTVKLDFLGANPNVRPVAQEPTEAVISYFKGRPDEWHAGLRTFRRLVYADLWPGIDLVYYGTVSQMKYEFIVDPGADPAQIRLTYRGASEVRVNANEQLEVTTPLGGFADDAPVAYQDLDGKRAPVPLAYALDDKGPLSESHQYGFHVGDYDSTRPLVLDPAVLVYAGYIGGADADLGYGIAVDESGSAYVTGLTDSDQATFPVTSGPDVTFNGADVGDSFVAKVNAAGTALVYAGYIGGAGWDKIHGIAVDGAGEGYVGEASRSRQTPYH
mgnify:FL=1